LKEVIALRVDKYLKVSRLIKRRTVAAEACEKGRIFINEKKAKPGTVVKEGDILELHFGANKTRIQILSVKEPHQKDGAKEMYEIL
jgi:ribosomal 50S subunit-recycling heat shock protein